MNCSVQQSGSSMNTERIESIISTGSNVYLSIIMGDSDMAKEMTNKY